MKYVILLLFASNSLYAYCQSSLGVRFIVKNDTVKKLASIRIDMKDAPSNVILYNVICHLEQYDKKRNKIKDVSFTFTRDTLRYLSAPNSYLQKYLFNDKSVYAIKGVRLSFKPDVIGQTASTDMKFDSTLLADLSEIQFERHTEFDRLLPQEIPFIVRNCPLVDFSEIIFIDGTATLSTKAKNTLNLLSKEIKSAPCKLKISGSTRMDTYAQQDLNFMRLKAVTDYLIKNRGLESSKLVLTFEPTIERNKVSLISAMQ